MKFGLASLILGALAAGGRAGSKIKTAIVTLVTTIISLFPW